MDRPQIGDIMFRKFSIVVLVLLALLSGCKEQSLNPNNGITQVATIDALLAGVYDGHMTLEALSGYGNFGIGTYEALDGEMVLIGGEFYKIRADGKVYRPALTEKTPFACVTKFTTDRTETIKGYTDLNALEKQIDALVPQSNRFCAFVIHGDFKRVKVRSVPAQKKPYPPLAEVTKSQPVFELSNVRGTLIGFRIPEFAKGINVPGYHMHFIVDDLSGGGHVLEVEIIDGVLEVDSKQEWLNIYMPISSSSFGTADLKKDRAADLERVEK